MSTNCSFISNVTRKILDVNPIHFLVTKGFTRTRRIRITMHYASLLKVHNFTYAVREDTVKNLHQVIDTNS